MTTIPSKKAMYSRLKSKQRGAMAEFMDTYGADSTNIIFAPRRTTAEGYALALAKLRSRFSEETEDERTNELIDYLSNEIHPKYSLIRCLRRGVAFHHGSIPELAKLEIEELYKSGAIKNLACTTTLLEGVNLPADKIFIFRPFISDSRRPLNSFEFGNLIGRAGRVSSKLHGSVYCIELDDDKWANEKLDSDFKKEITTATNKAFYQYGKQLLENLTKKSTQIDAEQAVIYTITLLRHKALRSISELKTYLESKNLTPEEFATIIKGISESIENLDIPEEIVKLNPTLDPLLQEELYQRICKEELKNWLITKHPMRRHDGKNSREVSFQEKNFYYQFEEIADKLDQIFDIQGSINRSHRSRYEPRYHIHTIVYNALLWIQQQPLRFMIERELGEDDDLKKIDRAILTVISRINNDVKFELVKYFNLWADILRKKCERFLTSEDPEFEEERKRIAYQLSLPEWLELGACTPNAITMIRSGINRSAAIEAARYIPRGIREDPISWLVEYRLDRLSPIVKRHIKNQGF